MTLTEWHKTLSPETRGDLEQIFEECRGHRLLDVGRFMVRLVSFVREPKYPALVFADTSERDCAQLSDVFLAEGTKRLDAGERDIAGAYLGLAAVCLRRAIHGTEDRLKLEAMLRQ